MVVVQEDRYLRVILHLDLDCFYAQVEHNRLKIPLSVPLAVQQWNGLIAVNYAARDSGVKRHTAVAEALMKCPQLRLVHVPTYSVTSTVTGDDEIVAVPQYRDEMPAYRSDGTRLPPNPPDPASNKACLEPYRHASMAIFRLIRDWCTQHNEGIRLEKGGLDEAFIDITEEVEQQLIDEFDQKYTMIRDELDEADLIEENLKLYDTTWIDRLDYTGLGENAIDKNITESVDVIEEMRMRLGQLRIWKGCQLAESLRSRLRSDLNFIASIGIASNKMLAKLVSALYKPDKQTRIDPQHITEFMTRVPFEKIRMMGGKMGKSVLKEGREDYDSDGAEDGDDPGGSDNEHVDNTPVNVMASDLWTLSIPQLTERVGDRQTAVWIHQLIRGHDPSPVTPRSLTKSFMSAKSFRPAVREWPELHDWVVVLVGELWSRLAEEKENSGRWPSNIVIHFKSYSKVVKGAMWSNSGSITKSCEFPYASSIPSQATRSDFLAAVFKLLTAADTPAAPLFPMSRLAVSVTNFKALEADGKAKATRVDQFFKKQEIAEGETVQMTSGLARFFPEPPHPPPTTTITSSQSQVKKPTVSVLDMLKASSANRTNLIENPTDPDSSQTNTNISTNNLSKQPQSSVKRKKTSNPSDGGILKYFSKSTEISSPSSDNSHPFKCTEPKCNFKCQPDDSKAIQEHSDHHLALKLSLQP